MDQETTVKKVMKELIDFGFCKKEDKKTMYAYLKQVYAAGHDMVYTNSFTPRPVGQYTKEGELVNAFPSMEEAGKQTKISSSNIRRTFKKPKRKVAGGYLWKQISVKEFIAFAEAKIKSEKAESDLLEPKTHASKKPSGRSPRVFP